MKLVEVLVVQRDDRGNPVDPPKLLVNERLMSGREHPNGQAFTVVCDDPDRECDHEWVDATNEIVTSGQWCPKCNAVRGVDSA